MTKVAAFVPLKLKSRRLPNKNFLRLGDRPLAYHIFNTLAHLTDINSGIFCFTSQPQVLSLLPPAVELIMRPRRLDGDEVKANELFQYAVENIDADIIVLCHATGPFVKPQSIEAGVRAVVSGDYDCAFAVSRHQTYCWYNGKPLNYSPHDMAQTQDLEPVYSETSGFYVFRKNSYLQKGTRISGRPFLVEVDFKEAVDIDEPADFALASQLVDYDPLKYNYSTDKFFIDIANNAVQYKNIKHISLDLDGVLVDSLTVMNIAWDEAMQSIGRQIDFSEYRKHIGVPFYDILERLECKKDEFEIIADVYNKSARSNLNKIKIYDGVIEAIQRAKNAGLLVSLVTSKNRERTDEIISVLLVKDSFDIVITPEDVSPGRGKPHPDPLLLACVNLGVDPANSIYVGDMASDRESAVRAGVHFVHANWGFSDITEAKDIWFNNIQDMMDFILN